MNNQATTVWEDRQVAASAQSQRDTREWRRNFVLVFALIALTVAVATAIARLGASS